MPKLVLLLLLPLMGLNAQVHPLQGLIDAARTDSADLKELLGQRLPLLNGRDGVAVWGQEFLFAVQSEKDAPVSIDKEPPVPMKRVPGTNYWYLLKMLRL